MTDRDIIRKIMKERGITQEEVAKKLGYAQQSGVGNRLNQRGSMSTSSFAKFLKALGCRLQVVDDNGVVGEIEEG